MDAGKKCATVFAPIVFVLIACSTPTPPPVEAPTVEEGQPMESPPVESPPTGTRIVSGDGYEGVIVGRAEVPAFFRAFSGESVEGWDPTEADVRAIEGAMPEWLQTAGGELGAPIAPRLRGYRRQYVGVVEGSRRLIYVNAFCSNPPNWKEHPVAVDDGGDCYFQLYWDTERRTFERLMVNGHG